MSWFSFGKKAEKKPEEEYKEQLSQLEKIGYKDRVKNLALLKLHNGDANHVIQAYVIENKKSSSTKSQSQSQKPKTTTSNIASKAQSSSSQQQSVATTKSSQPSKPTATKVRAQPPSQPQPKSKPVSTSRESLASATGRNQAATKAVKVSPQQQKQSPSSTQIQQKRLQPEPALSSANEAIKPKTTIAAPPAKIAAAAAETTSTTSTSSTATYAWSCRTCGMKNPIAEWKCVACFRPIQRTMQRGQNVKQRKRDTLTPEDASDSVAYTLSDDIPATMKALVKDNKAGGRLVLKTDEAVPMPQADELLVRSCAVSIGDADTMYDCKLDGVPGYEAAGLVVGVGKDCRFRIGDRVAIENRFYCGECSQCSANRKHLCVRAQFGNTDNEKAQYNGFSEYFVVKEKYAYRLQADISWRDAAMLASLGVAHHACEQVDSNVQRARNRATGAFPPDTVLIVGCSTIGCLAVAVAKSMPYTRNVIACDAMDDRLEVAKKMGADVVFNVATLKVPLKQKILELTDNVGVGKLIECSGDTSMIDQAFGCLRKGGSICLVGLPKNPITFAHPMQDLVFRCIQICSAHGRRIFSTWNKTEKLVSNNTISLDPLMSLVLPLTEFEAGYQAIKSGKTLNVVFDLTKS
mmetsp:Transcript_57182/g.95003  ORF Transcript_57182/g.95003 Transcript_57182/m.95003 type:complete len:634 (+) Transcript_57182:31-1932(+)